MILKYINIVFTLMEIKIKISKLMILKLKWIIKFFLTNYFLFKSLLGMQLVRDKDLNFYIFLLMNKRDILQNSLVLISLIKLELTQIWVQMKEKTSIVKSDSKFYLFS